MLQDVIYLLPVVALGHGLRTECDSHRRYGTRIVVHAVILRVDVLHDSERKYYQDKRQPFHHLNPLLSCLFPFARNATVRFRCSFP